MHKDGPLKCIKKALNIMNTYIKENRNSKYRKAE